MTIQERFADLRKQFHDAYTAAFLATPEACAGGAGQIVFQNVAVAALCSVANEVGIDAGVPLEQIQKVQAADYAAADAAWPVWG